MRKPAGLVSMVALVGCGEPGTDSVDEPIRIAAYVRQPGEDCFTYRYIEADTRYWAGWPDEALCGSDEVPVLYMRPSGDCVFMPRDCHVGASNDDPSFWKCFGPGCSCRYDDFISEGTCPGQLPYDWKAWTECVPAYPHADCGNVPQ